MKEQATVKCFLAVKAESSTEELQWGQDIFARPMPWSLWFKAITPLKRNPWRFVRVMDLPLPLRQYNDVIIEGDEVFFDDEHHYKLERPGLLNVIIWVVESFYYRTSFKFWEWPIFRKIINFFSHF